MVRCTAVDEAVLDAIRRAARPHGARAQPVPPLGRDVGRVGRLTTRGYFLGGAHGRRHRRRAGRGDQLRRTGCSITGTGPRSAADSLLEFEPDGGPVLPDRRHEDGASPAALGNRIAAAAIESGLADELNEAGGYTSPRRERALKVAARGRTVGGPEPLAAAPARAGGLAERHPHRRHRPAVPRTALGLRHGVRPSGPRRRGGVDPDRRRCSTRSRRRLQDRGRGGDRQERPARPRSRGHDRYLPRRPRRQRARNERR